MTASRWTLILLAAGTTAAGWWFATRQPAEKPPAAPATPAASPLNLPLPAATSEPGASVATRAPAPAPSAALAASAPRIGSEGYGPHIERAQAGSDAAAAWEAVTWMRQCANNAPKRSSLETLRGQGVSPEMMTQMMVEADAEARRCQTVTAQHRAMLPELAARAMRAGVPEAASAYASAVFPNDLTPVQRQEVADAMRRDALAGDSLSLLGATLAHETWGLSDAERAAFLYAYAELPGHPENKFILKPLLEQKLIRFKTEPTAEQQAAAKLAGQQIIERVRAGKQP